MTYQTILTHVSVDKMKSMAGDPTPVTPAGEHGTAGHPCLIGRQTAV
jgi:hypothetical protein